MRISLRHKQHHLAVDVHPEGGAYRIGIGDSEHAVEAHYIDETTMMLVVDGVRHHVAIVRKGKEQLVAIGGEIYTFAPESSSTAGHMAVLAPPEIIAPMPGKVLQVLVKAGDQVAAGDGLLILEAMKMENRLVAEAAGTVTDVRVTEGAMVDGGQVLVVMRYDE
ncbi:MAG: acetyl-CoA carboxylase biotin carboxyl carrier protein subunit [Deltaproteobacteria bacterium]|nr:acetyl-CoA carboxylase biotin carboxyl carrier protein subunit [Deltaproteobacteria bacterium]MBI3389643.1 acetyl-CoA carboxylase biotin carboxyl carrier protein subunit [Deltaproteobacteria bacterium]